MKYTPFTLAGMVILAIGSISACNKSSSSSKDGCISRFQPDLTQRVIPQSKFDSVQMFFQANGLSTDSLQPLSFVNTPAAGPGLFYQVPVRKLVNGLPVFNGRLKYDFYDGKLSDIDSVVYDYPVANPDTTGHLGLDKLREIFLASNPDSYANRGNLVAVPSHKTHWADSCIYATLQYIDQYSVDCCSGAAVHVLIKSWNITARPDGPPLAVIIDDSQKLIAYVVQTVN